MYMYVYMYICIYIYILTIYLLYSIIYTRYVSVAIKPSDDRIHCKSEAQSYGNLCFIFDFLL